MAYKLKCNCGADFESESKRSVEAKMWVHAIKDHQDMVSAMTEEQLAGLMEDWDRDFDEQ